MRKIYKVAEREFNETVKTRTFLLGLLLIPMIIGGILLFGDKLAPRKDAPRPPVRVRVASPARELSQKIEAIFEEYNKAHPLGSISLDVVSTPDERPSRSRARTGLRRDQLDALVSTGG